MTRRKTLPQSSVGKSRVKYNTSRAARRNDFCLVSIHNIIIRWLKIIIIIAVVRTYAQKNIFVRTRYYSIGKGHVEMLQRDIWTRV